MTEREELLKLVHSQLVHLRADCKRWYRMLAENKRANPIAKNFYEHLTENLTELNEMVIKLLDMEGLIERENMRVTAEKPIYIRSITGKVTQVDKTYDIIPPTEIKIMEEKEEKEDFKKKLKEEVERHLKSEPSFTVRALEEVDPNYGFGGSGGCDNWKALQKIQQDKANNKESVISPPAEDILNRLREEFFSINCALIEYPLKEIPDILKIDGSKTIELSYKSYIVLRTCLRNAASILLEADGDFEDKGDFDEI